MAASTETTVILCSGAIYCFHQEDIDPVLDTLLITPHLGGATVESMHKTEEFMARKLVRFLREAQ